MYVQNWLIELRFMGVKKRETAFGEQYMLLLALDEEEQEERIKANNSFCRLKELIVL